MNDFHPLFDTVPLNDVPQTRHDLSSRDWANTKWSSITPDCEPSSPSTRYSLYPTPPNSLSSKTDEGSTPFSRRAFVRRPELRIGTYLSSGRLADTFTSDLDSEPSVIKFIDLATFDGPDPEAYDVSSAISALCNEIKLYTTRLRPLQGIVVPRLLRVFVGNTPDWDPSRPVVMMVLEDVGEAVADTWSAVSAIASYVPNSLFPSRSHLRSPSLAPLPPCLGLILEKPKLMGLSYLNQRSHSRGLPAPA